MVTKGIKKLQELAAEIKNEFLTRLAATNSNKDTQIHTTDLTTQYEEDKEMWKAEKTSLESYISELEQRLAYYEKESSKSMTFPNMMMQYPPQVIPPWLPTMVSIPPYAYPAPPPFQPTPTSLQAPFKET